jgi:hypothetical protein
MSDLPEKRLRSRVVGMSSAPKEHNISAQGNALGAKFQHAPDALKGNAVSHFRLRFSCRVREVFFVLEHLFS